MVCLNTLAYKLHFLTGYAPSGQTQAQHIGVSVPLGVTSVNAGKMFVVCFVHFAIIEIRGLFPEKFQILILEPSRLARETCV